MDLQQRFLSEVDMSTSQKKLYFAIFCYQIEYESFYILAMCLSQKFPGGRVISECEKL